jgi:3-phenylpropionate/trans-cinnamate dioxygenase ferredoxin reductase subunit
LRTLEDAHRLRTAMRAGARLLVIGGGYVGLEVAATARLLGMHVTIVERERRLLARVASPQLSGWLDDVFRGKGIAIEAGHTVAGFTSGQGALTGAVLGDGRHLGCDAALIGIGADPNDALMRDAGLPCDNGVWVDAHSATADPAVYAIGDCASRLMADGRRVRIESVPNAVEQAKQAAAAICGRAPAIAETPWFWSDQFDLRIQIAGLHGDAVETVLRHDPDGANFAAFHLDAAGAVRVVEAVNATPEFMIGRQMIQRGQRIDSTCLADTRRSMHQIANPSS